MPIILAIGKFYNPHRFRQLTRNLLSILFWERISYHLPGTSKSLQPGANLEKGAIVWMWTSLGIRNSCIFQSLGSPQTWHCTSSVSRCLRNQTWPSRVTDSNRQSALGIEGNILNTRGWEPDPQDQGCDQWHMDSHQCKDWRQSTTWFCHPCPSTTWEPTVNTTAVVNQLLPGCRWAGIDLSKQHSAVTLSQGHTAYRDLERNCPVLTAFIYCTSAEGLKDSTRCHPADGCTQQGRQSWATPPCSLVGTTAKSHEKKRPGLSPAPRHRRLMGPMIMLLSRHTHSSITEE
jgi:hypothetical protein